MVAAAQKEDPFCKRVEKELAAQAQAKSTPGAGQAKASSDSTRPHYSRTDDEVLLYKGRLVVPNQRSLVHELLRLHHDEPIAGH